MSNNRFFIPSADRRLGDRYELIECLGDGSHGWVWKAQRLDDNSIVALKIPKDQGGTNSELEEGQILVSAPPHPHVVSVRWMGRVPPEREWYVIELEYFAGMTLAKLFENHEQAFTSSYAAIFDVYAQILAGVAYLHNLGMAHGDIKPHNVLVAGDQAKVTDFGSSLQPEEMYVRSRENGGTILYSAPEMLGVFGPSRRKLNPYRADIYSLGVLLYYLLTTRLPHETSSQVERHAPFPRPREINKTVCPAAEDFVLRCLAKEPEDRWPSIQMMIEELPKVRRFQLEYSSVASVSRPAAAVADWSSEVMAHFEKKEYQSAEIAAHRQFTANKDPYAFLLMVQAAARDGRHFDCLKYLERHPGQSQPPAKYADELRRISVDAQLAVRSIDAAEKTINQLITEGREDRVLLLKKASVLGLQARFDEARELLLDLNRRYSGNPAILKRLVIVNEQLRDFSKAAAFLRALRELAPNDAWANSKWANYKALGAA